jgi:hypothetical protein
MIVCLTPRLHERLSQRVAKNKELEKKIVNIQENMSKAKGCPRSLHSFKGVIYWFIER